MLIEAGERQDGLPLFNVRQEAETIPASHNTLPSNDMSCASKSYFFATKLPPHDLADQTAKAQRSCGEARADNIKLMATLTI